MRIKKNKEFGKVMVIYLQTQLIPVSFVNKKIFYNIPTFFIIEEYILIQLFRKIIIPKKITGEYIKILKG